MDSNRNLTDNEEELREFDLNQEDDHDNEESVATSGGRSSRGILESDLVSMRFNNTRNWIKLYIFTSHC